MVVRHIRLTGRSTATVDDPIALVLAAECAWRAGDVRIAAAGFEAAGPKPGTAAANHAARRVYKVRAAVGHGSRVTTDRPTLSS